MSKLVRSIGGSPDTVRFGMDAFIAETGTDELMLVLRNKPSFDNCSFRESCRTETRPGS
jgi:hypothetical protein